MMQTNTHHSHFHQFICIYPMINYPPLMRIIICPAKADPANAVGSFPVHEAKDRVRLLQHKTSLHRRSVAKEAVRHKEVVHVRCKHLETIRLLRSRRRQRQKYSPKLIEMQTVVLTSRLDQKRWAEGPRMQPLGKYPLTMHSGSY